MKTLVLILTVGLVCYKVQGDRWWTGCQLDSWAVKGCAEYNMLTLGQTPCPGGNKYHCSHAYDVPYPDPNPNPSSHGVQISENEFRSAVTGNGYPSPSISQYNSYISQMSKGQINTKQEAAMALAQFIHESGGLVYKREMACEQSNCPNDYRTPGCDAPGQYYYGRGYIQLSWCYNYKPASQDLYGDLRLVDNPDQVAANEDVAWATSYWFWGKNVHNNGGASGQFGATTNAINGGLECRGGPNDKANRRFQIYGIVRQAYGLPGAGDSSGCGS